MRFYTHLTFTIALYVVLIQFTVIPFTVISSIIFLLASWIPDIDETQSKTAKKTKPISWIIHLLFGHRGFFHSLWLPIIGFFLIPVYGSVFAIGYCSHLILDAITPHGIQPFYPLKFKLKGPIRTGSVWEVFLFTGIIFYIVYYSVRHFISPLFSP